MAAYFKVNGRDIQKHIGTKLGFSSEHVTEVQLDGDELEFVRNEFTNVRMCRDRIVTLFGDDARFVAHHWE